MGRIWNRYLTMLTWNRRDSTPLSATGPEGRSRMDFFFWSYKSLSVLAESGPYRIFVLVFSWVSAVPGEHCQMIAVSNPTQAGQRFTWSKTWCDRQQLWKALITGDTVTRLSIPIRGRGKITWRRSEVKFGRNVVKEETTQKLQRWEKKSAINKNEFSDVHLFYFFFPFLPLYSFFFALLLLCSFSFLSLFLFSLSSLTLYIFISLSFFIVFTLFS